jgi:caffeoyl-CoA O-methyltransferase
MDLNKTLRHLHWMEETETGMWNIARAEGEHLRRLTMDLQAKRVLEIGTSNGYSTIWLALGVSTTGGKVITLEADPERHALAKKNFERTGAIDHVDSRLGDAMGELDSIEGPLDFVFIDAWKADYPVYLDLCIGKVRKGGLIVAHNLESHREELMPFRERLLADDTLETEFVNLGPGGFSISKVLGNRST